MVKTDKMNAITGVKLQDEILMIAALSVFADKNALVMLNSSRRYAEHALSKMKADGLISEREEKESNRPSETK